MFDKNSIIIELVGYSSNVSRLVKIAKYYADKGYKIALTEYDLNTKWDVIFPYITMIKVDIEATNPKRLQPIVERLRNFDIKLVAEKVETHLQLQSLTEVGFNYYQGFFYHQPEIIKGQQLAPVKSQMLNLINTSLIRPLNFNAIADIISQDVNLSIGLLKMVNNVASGNRIEITSLKQATAYLGEDKLTQFINILALSKLASDKTNELSKQALITGKLMSAIATNKVFNEIQQFAFITGLLSAIEVILSMSFSDILKTMPLAVPIEQALVERNGLLGELLQLTTNYITGTDDSLHKLSDDYGIKPAFVHQEFIKASDFVSKLAL
jgi:EAL and modified HD-GYP domain-containing signal transduction protein